MVKNDFPTNEHRPPVCRTLRLEGRDFGYHSVSIGLWDTVFLWVGLKRWLSAWAFGFEIIAGSILFFVGPLVFGIGLIKLARLLKQATPNNAKPGFSKKRGSLERMEHGGFA